MLSGSPSTQTTRQSPPILANLIGTAIALITLILPIVVIANYSSNESALQPPSDRPMIQAVSRP